VSAGCESDWGQEKESGGGGGGRAVVDGGKTVLMVMVAVMERGSEDTALGQLS